MYVLKFINYTSGTFIYSKANYRHFVTSHLKLSSKKFNFRRNNFSYKTNFHFAKEESKIASTDTISSQEALNTTSK